MSFGVGEFELRRQHCAFHPCDARVGGGAYQCLVQHRADCGHFALIPHLSGNAELVVRDRPADHGGWRDYVRQR